MKLRNQSCQLILGHYKRQTYLFQREACPNFSRTVGTKFPTLGKNLPRLGIKIRNLGIFTPTAWSKNDHRINVLRSCTLPALAPLPQTLLRYPPLHKFHKSGHNPKPLHHFPYLPIHLHRPLAKYSLSWQPAPLLLICANKRRTAFIYRCKVAKSLFFSTQKPHGVENMSFFLIFNRHRRESIVSLQKIFEAC